MSAGSPKISAPDEKSPLAKWASRTASTEEFIITDELVELARQTFDRRGVVYLHHLVAVALQSFPTANAALRAIRSGNVSVDGCVKTAHDTIAPPIGSHISICSASMDEFPVSLETMLKKWHKKSPRPEARLIVLFEDHHNGWAIVNKPAGMHCNPCAFNASHLTFQAYLPVLLQPPLKGTCCRGPRVCHRLDFRVSGPVVVATTEEAMRALKKYFEERQVKKEYRAIVCGHIGSEGEDIIIDQPIDGERAETHLKVLRHVKCPHFEALTEVSLWPVTGRHQQLRRHCATCLGAPIVNDEKPLFETASPAWMRREGSALPPYVTRGGGNLFLQAVNIDIPCPSMQTEHVQVHVEVSDRFDRLMKTSARAWDEGWRMGADGGTYRVDADQTLSQEN